MESLFYVYLSCLIVGGTVVVLSALGGVGGDVDVEVDAADAGEGLQLLTLLKTRPLFFFACFFGLTGLLVGEVLGPIATLATALGMGVVCAWIANWVLGRLSEESSSSALEEEEYIGLEATVTVPITDRAKGKICSTVKGHTIELLACLPEGRPDMTSGTKVLILEMQDGVALVDAH